MSYLVLGTAQLGMQLQLLATASAKSVPPAGVAGQPASVAGSGPAV